MAKEVKEKEHLDELIKMCESWIQSDIVKATSSYKNWQHDKGSYAFGWTMGVLAVVEKLERRRDNLTNN